MIDNFLKYYESLESRPVFDSVEGMLKWSGLYNLTKVTLQEKLSEAQLSPLLVNELVTVKCSFSLDSFIISYLRHGSSVHKNFKKNFRLLQGLTMGRVYLSVD